MSKIMSGVSCAVICLLSCSPARAENLVFDVPLWPGSMTAQGTAAAQQDLKKVPGGADVVPAKDFQNSYALTMKDMMAKTPGITAQPRYGEEVRLSIRGSGLSRAVHLRGITLLQNGIPLNFADGSGDFQEIDPLMLQHIEVYRGGNGLRYGSGTLGGAVNMVMPTARTADYNVLLRADGGSDKTLRLHTEAAQVFGAYDIVAAGTTASGDGFRRQSAYDNQRFSGNAGAKLGRNAETRFYLNWNDVDQEVPGTISKFDALHNPTTVPAINITNDYGRAVESLRAANRTVYQFDNGMSLEGGIYGSSKSLYHPIFEVIDQDSVDVGTFSRLSGRYGDHEFVLGVNMGRGTNDAKRFTNVRGKRGVRTADATQVAKNFELYGENTYHFTQDWSLITGLQAKIGSRDYTDRVNSANNDDEVFKSINPKLGVMYKIDPQSEVFANISKSSESPTFSELVQGAFPGFVPVDQQKAWTAEIGSRGSRGSFSWDVTAYHSQLRDELLNFTVGAGIPASTFNAKKSIHQGLEIGLGWHMNDEISFQGIYNLNDFRFDSDRQFRNNDLAGAPKHQVRVSARYEKNGFYVEPNIEWVPQAPWVDYANTLKADEYALVGMKAGWEANENVSVFFDARNLTDKRMITSFNTVTDARLVGTNVFFPADGRSMFAGVKVKF